MLRMALSEQRYQKCVKLGRYNGAAKLAVSMAIQAILGAFLAALQSTTKFQQLYKIPAALVALEP